MKNITVRTDVTSEFQTLNWNYTAEAYLDNRLQPGAVPGH